MMLMKGIHVRNRLLAFKTGRLVYQFLSHFGCTVGHPEVWTKSFFLGNLRLKMIKTISFDLLFIR